MFEKKKVTPQFLTIFAAPGRWLDHLCHVHHLELVLDLYMLLSGLMTLAARFQGARFRGSNRLFAHTHTCL